jgi:hypothetical protein
VWGSLLEIQSFDDLGAFLERRPPTQANGLQLMTKADHPRPIQYDRREVSFTEDDYTVCLELISGNENYFTIASITLPTGEKYARSEATCVVESKVTLEVPGVAKYTWRQKMG